MFNMKLRKTEDNRAFISPMFGLAFFCLSLNLIWAVGTTSVTTEGAFPTEIIPETIPIIEKTAIGSPPIFGSIEMEEKIIAITDIDSPAIPASTPSHSLTDPYLRSLKLGGRRWMLGAMTDATANGKPNTINYNSIPRAFSRPNSPPNKAANPYQKGCNSADRCRQGGHKAKENGMKN